MLTVFLMSHTLFSLPPKYNTYQPTTLCVNQAPFHQYFPNPAQKMPFFYLMIQIFRCIHSINWILPLVSPCIFPSLSLSAYFPRGRHSYCKTLSLLTAGQSWKGGGLMTMGICHPFALKCGWADHLLKLRDIEVEESFNLVRLH